MTKREQLAEEYVDLIAYGAFSIPPESTPKHGLRRYLYRSCFLAGFDAHAKLAEEREKLLVEALKAYESFAVHWKIEGGVFSPDLGAFDRKTISDSGAVTIAKDALEKYAKMKGEA